MTGDGTCGVFIPEGVVVGKVAEPMGGRPTGRGGWSHNRLWKGEAYIARVYPQVLVAVACFLPGSG